LRVAVALLLLCTSAQAQRVAVPIVPDVPDEPLPEWKPPVRKTGALHLRLSPEVATGQKLRQTGVWVSSIGWSLAFAAGIIYVEAVRVNGTLSATHIIGYDPISMAPISSALFDPALEDERDRLQAASLTLFAVGGAMAAGGFIVYTLGQARISIAHKAHPKDPLPPLSGY
jgi:hypothetical protein